MTIFYSILLAIFGLIALILIIALIRKKEHFVSREIIINVPSQKVFDYVKYLRNQDNFNKNAMAGPDRTKTFKGTDGTEGYIYSWSGDKSAGVGEKEIKKIIEGKRVESEIRFIKPMAVKATVIMQTEAIAANQTRVTWSNEGVLPYPFNVMIPMMEKSVAQDMDKSLVTLKKILEN